MITVPTLTYEATPGQRAPAGYYAHVTIANSWTVWTYLGVRYWWQDGELMARDTEGRQWRFKNTVGIWVHVQERAA